MLDFLMQGGPIMIPLALCSVVAVLITAERLLSLRRPAVFPREIVGAVELAEPGRDLSMALQLCERNPGVYSGIMHAVLAHGDHPAELAREAVRDAGRQNVPQLERHLVWLETVAAAAPLLGLLGTVLGMIKMFEAVSAQGLGDPQVLSEGISEAMITTAIGLAIGIPTLVAYNLLAARADALASEIEARAHALLTRLQGGPRE